jgi:hypothetical protein
MSNLKIYGVPLSRAYRALWMANELGLDHESGASVAETAVGARSTTGDSRLLDRRDFHGRGPQRCLGEAASLCRPFEHGPMAGRMPEEGSCGKGTELHINMPDDGNGGELALQSPFPFVVEFPRPPCTA